MASDGKKNKVRQVALSLYKYGITAEINKRLSDGYTFAGQVFTTATSDYTVIVLNLPTDENGDVVPQTNDI